MKIHRLLLAGIVAGISALAVSSCAYDPYYSGASYSSGGGYGDGYGYGSSNFTTSFFVSTGSPRWGYDPYAGAYYDYTRRCYYDPYLSGYYPRGYRPRYVHGAPHPHGWSRGRNSIAPPSRIRSYNLTNYQNRGERYQGLGRDWSKNVRINTPSRDPRSSNSRDPRSDNRGRSSNQSGSFGDRGSSNRGSIFGGDNSSSQGRTYGDRNDRSSGRRDSGATRQPAPSRSSGGFISAPDRNSTRTPGSFGGRERVVPQPQPQQPRPSFGGDRGAREQSPRPQMRQERQSRPEMQPRSDGGGRGRGTSPSGGGSRGPRGLGQG